MKKYLNKLIFSFIASVLISALEIKSMDVDEQGGSSSRALAGDQSKLDRKRSSGQVSPDNISISDTSPEKKKRKLDDSTYQDFSQILVAVEETQKILPLKKNLSSLSEEESDVDFSTLLKKQKISDYSIQHKTFPFQITAILISWKTKQEVLLEKAFDEEGELRPNKLIIFSDSEFSCAFSFKRSPNLIVEWVDDEAINTLSQQSQSGTNKLFHKYDKKEESQKKPARLKVTVNNKGQDAVEFFHEIKQDALGIVGPFQEVRDFLSNAASDEVSKFQDVKKDINLRIQSFVGQGMEIQDALLKMFRILNTQEAKAALETIFTRTDRLTPYKEILAQVFLPDDLRVPFYPNFYVDWRQIPELNFRVALMAPHHDVAKYRLSSLLGRWSSMLANQTDGLRKAEEHPNEVNEALKGFLDKKEAVNNLYQRVNNWELSLTEDLKRSDDPIYAALKGKKDDRTKAALEAQNTGEVFWVLGKITKDRAQSLEYYRRAAELGNPLGFIGMGQKMPDPVEKLILYFQAVEKGNPYGWEAIAAFFSDRSQGKPLTESFLRKEEPSESTSSSSCLESLAPIRAALGAVDMGAILKADMSFLTPYHQLSARACLKAGEVIPASYNKLTTMLEQYRTGWTQGVRPVDPKDIESIEETLYELMYKQGDTWGEYQIKGFRNKGPELYKELGNFKDYLEVTFSDENKPLYEEAFILFESYLNLVKRLYDSSSAQIVL